MKIQSSHEVVLERTKRALDLKAAGKTSEEIAKELGVSTGALHYYIYTVGKVVKRQPKRRGVVSVLGGVNGHSADEYDKLTSLLADVLRLLPDDKLVEM